MSKGTKEYSEICRELWNYIRFTRKYWMAPVIFVLLIMGSLFFIMEGSIVAPFIYAIF